MILSEPRYNSYALVREMFETPRIIRDFNPDAAAVFAGETTGQKILLTGEGSSRIFPAKRAVYHNNKQPLPLTVYTEGSLQSMEYILDEVSVFGSSNSGRTRELITLMAQLKDKGHRERFGLTAAKNSPLREYCTRTHILSCGSEEAVAATKSVIEQALFYDALLSSLSGDTLTGLGELADNFMTVLESTADRTVIKTLADADMIYFAGKNNGVAEELALKTNEIVRKKSGFLEGTYAVHGIEEVLSKRDVLVWIDPFEEEIEKFRSVLTQGAGVEIIAVSGSPLPLPGIRVPDGGRYSEYLQMAAGWMLLVETGLELGIDLDKPVRARKIGNEFQ